MFSVHSCLITSLVTTLLCYNRADLASRDSVCTGKYHLNTEFHATDYGNWLSKGQIQLLHISTTEENQAESLRILSGSGGSFHYIVALDSDPSDWTIFQMLNDSRIGYHAGVSYWQGKRSINSVSLGITLINKKIDSTEDTFSDCQIQALISLLRKLQRTYNICATCIVGYGDVASQRKSAPGSLFPWKQLYDNNLGFWPNGVDVDSFKANYTKCSLACALVKLNVIGYEVPDISDGAAVGSLTTNFQNHFRNSDTGGQMDVETCAIIESLVSKYFHNNIDSCQLGIDLTDGGLSGKIRSINHWATVLISLLLIIYT